MATGRMRKVRVVMPTHNFAGPAPPPDLSIPHPPLPLIHPHAPHVLLFALFDFWFLVLVVFLFFHNIEMTNTDPSLEGNEAGRVGGTDTGTTVLYRLVGDGELSSVVTNHLGLKGNEEKKKRKKRSVLHSWAPKKKKKGGGGLTLISTWLKVLPL